MPLQPAQSISIRSSAGLNAPIDELFGIRNATSIPSAQSVLLSRHDSWAVDFENGDPQRQVNVPLDILQELRDFHSLAKRDAGACLRNSEDGGSVESEEPHNLSSDEAQSEISWDQSPEEHMRRPLKSTVPNQAQPLSSPIQNPEQHFSLDKPRYRLRSEGPIEDIASSCDSQDDLEFSVAMPLVAPDIVPAVDPAVTSAVTPAKRAAETDSATRTPQNLHVPDFTPPTQLNIPSTDRDASTPLAASRKRRKMKRVTLEQFDSMRYGSVSDGSEAKAATVAPMMSMSMSMPMPLESVIPATWDQLGRDPPRNGRIGEKNSSTSPERLPPVPATTKSVLVRCGSPPIISERVHGEGEPSQIPRLSPTRPEHDDLSLSLSSPTLNRPKDKHGISTIPLEDLPTDVNDATLPANLLTSGDDIIESRAGLITGKSQKHLEKISDKSLLSDQSTFSFFDTDGQIAYHTDSRDGNAEEPGHLEEEEEEEHVVLSWDPHIHAILNKEETTPRSEIENFPLLFGSTGELVESGAVRLESKDDDAKSFLSQEPMSSPNAKMRYVNSSFPESAGVFPQANAARLIGSPARELRAHAHPRFTDDSKLSDQSENEDITHFNDRNSTLEPTSISGKRSIAPQRTSDNEPLSSSVLNASTAMKRVRPLALSRKAAEEEENKGCKPILISPPDYKKSDGRGSEEPKKYEDKTNEGAQPGDGLRDNSVEKPPASTICLSSDEEGEEVIKKGGRRDSTADPPLDGDRLDARRLFEAYCAAYPQFSSTFVEFNDACTCLKHYHKHSMVSPFLYDDIVRAYIEEYVVFARNLRPQEQQPALYMWYNSNVTEPEFTRRVITRETLFKVPKDYLSKFASAEPLETAEHMMTNSKVKLTSGVVVRRKVPPTGAKKVSTNPVSSGSRLAALPPSDKGIQLPRSRSSSSPQPHKPPPLSRVSIISSNIIIPRSSEPPRLATKEMQGKSLSGSASLRRKPGSNNHSAYPGTTETEPKTVVVQEDETIPFSRVPFASTDPVGSLRKPRQFNTVENNDWIAGDKTPALTQPYEPRPSSKLTAAPRLQELLSRRSNSAASKRGRSGMGAFLLSNIAYVSSQRSSQERPRSSSYRPLDAKPSHGQGQGIARVARTKAGGKQRVDEEAREAVPDEKY